MVKNKTNFNFLISLLSTLFTILLGIFLVFHQLIVRLPDTSVLLSDNYDAHLIYWITNWGYHIFFEAGQPAAFFNSNAYYPQSNTLAYSYSLLGMQIFFSPLRLLGTAPLPAIYLSLALTIIAAGLLSFLALRRVGLFSTLEIAFIIFGAFFSLTATSYLTRYQLFGFYLAVPFLIHLYLFLKDLRFLDLVMVCMLYLWGTFYAIYLAPMLLVYSLFLGIPLVLIHAQKKWKAYLKTLFQMRNLLTVFFFALVIYFLQIRPYLLVSSQPTTDSIERVILFSAPPLALLQNVSADSLWYKLPSIPPGYWESSYFPGFVLLLTGLAFFLQRGWELYRLRPSRWINAPGGHQPEVTGQVNSDVELFTFFIILFFLISLVLSFGPFIRTGLNSAYSIPLPYYFLMKVIPGMSQMRVPGRFGMLLGLPLAVFGVRFFQQLGLGHPRSRLALWLAFVLLVVESVPSYPLVCFQPDPSGLYHWLGQKIRPDQSLVELPLSDNGEGDNLIAANQLVGSTFHWAKIASGYGAKETYEYRDLVNADIAFQKGQQDVASIMNLARKYQFDYLLVNLDRYAQANRARWVTLTGHCTSYLVYPPGNALLIKIHSCSQ